MGIEDNVEAAVEDAAWHIHIADAVHEEDAPHRITVGYCILSLIRGTDALYWQFKKEKPPGGRSHDAHKHFITLYDENRIPQKYARYRSNMEKWVAREKTKAQYQGKNYAGAGNHVESMYAMRSMNKGWTAASAWVNVANTD
jgi:hypothetical protein